MTRDEAVAKLDELLAGPHDYESSARAARDAAVVAFNLMADHLGLTGFQAGFAALSALGEMLHIDGPYGIVRAENALYPQYDEVGKVAGWVENEWSDWLREKAAERLSTPAAPVVKAHWRRLAAGVSS